VKSHRAALVAMHFHRQHGRGCALVRPAAQALQQRAGGGAERVGAHVAVAAGGVGRRRHQRHAQALARQQQRQRAAHNAGATDANVD
jgi:hypothetical protein